MTMTAGTVFLMWLGEQIDEYGIGNGISLLIMAGILARMPGAGLELIGPMLENGLELGGQFGVDKLVVLVVLVRRASWSASSSSPRDNGAFPRKAPSTSAAAASTAARRQYLPLRVNQAGVMPIIFASSLLLFPQVLFSYLQQLRRASGSRPARRSSAATDGSTTSSTSS